MLSTVALPRTGVLHLAVLGCGNGQASAGPKNGKTPGSGQVGEMGRSSGDRGVVGQVQADQYIPEEDIHGEMDTIERQLDALEHRGVLLEEKLRGGVNGVVWGAAGRAWWGGGVLGGRNLPSTGGSFEGCKSCQPWPQWASGFQRAARMTCWWTGSSSSTRSICWCGGSPSSSMCECRPLGRLLPSTEIFPAFPPLTAWGREAVRGAGRRGRGFRGGRG